MLLDNLNPPEQIITNSGIFGPVQERRGVIYIRRDAGSSSLDIYALVQMYTSIWKNIRIGPQHLRDRG